MSDIMDFCRDQADEQTERDREANQYKRTVAEAWSRLTGWDARRLENGSHEAAGDPCGALLSAITQVLHERDAYKRAKSENDERFMLERDEARQNTEQLETELDEARKANAQQYERIKELEAALVVSEREKAEAIDRLATAMELENNTVWRDMCATLSAQIQETRREREQANEWLAQLTDSRCEVTQLLGHACTPAERALVEAAVAFHQTHSRPVEPTILGFESVTGILSDTERYRKLCESVIAEREAKA